MVFQYYQWYAIRIIFSIKTNIKITKNIFKLPRACICIIFTCDFAFNFRPSIDTTYLYPSSGLQLLQCYSNYKTDFTGGRVTLTDSFAVLHDSQREFPSIFDYFTKLKLKDAYSDKNDLFVNDQQRVIGINKDNKHEPLNIDYFRFNNEDRATMNYLDYEETMEFYENWQVLDEFVRNPQYQIKFVLHPGQMVIFNNWKVLHGRQMFSAKREMVRCCHESQMWKAQYYKLKQQQRVLFKNRQIDRQIKTKCMNIIINNCNLITYLYLYNNK